MQVRIVFTAVFVVCLAFPSFADKIRTTKPERAGMSSERLERINAMAERYVDEGRFPGIITLVARDGKLVHTNVVGQRGVDDPRPLEMDHLFRIYSMTKPVTAVAAMQLYEQGKFHLSDPVEKFIPEVAGMKVQLEDGSLVEPSSKMTMHQLLTHTAGLGYGLFPGHPVEKQYIEAELWRSTDLDHFAEKVGKLPLRYHPGEQWHYSVAVDLTGLVVQRISGMPYDEYLDKHLFTPLGMDDTFFEVPADKLDRLLPNHYIDRESRTLKTIDIDAGLPIIGGTAGRGVAMMDFEKVTLYSGGGGLVSTAMDYLKFGEMLRRGGELDGVRILGEKTVNYMRKNHLAANLSAGGSGEQPTSVFNWQGYGFGLGFGTVESPVKSAVLSSKGEYSWGGAAGTIFWVDPVEQIVVVGMVQLMGAPWPFRPDLRVGTYQAITDSYE